jgi:hypothetical protein
LFGARFVNRTHKVPFDPKRAFQDFLKNPPTSGLPVSAMENSKVPASVSLLPYLGNEDRMPVIRPWREPTRQRVFRAMTLRAGFVPRVFP